MASSCPSTRGLDGEAALDCPADSTPVVTFSFTDNTITSVDLAPTQLPHPRPWKRIAVPGAGTKLGLRTVWKRIGGVPRSSADTQYFQSVVELRADGTGLRKNRRTERYVPVWGDAQWQIRDTESTEDDLAKAREAVANVTKKAEVNDTNILGRSLAFVPRKRNSRRQPLTISLPPPTEPLAAQSPVRPTSAVDESLEAIEQSAEHITKRAKRRMSRRISILPKLEECGPLLSPEKKTVPPHVFSSPVKRRVSMAAIHEPPATPGTPAMPLTPGTAKSAKSTPSIAPPIAFEPSFSSPIKTLAPISENLSPAKAASPIVKQTIPMSPVIVFDRPAAEEMEAESPQEVRRRISLHNTRRRETLFSTVERQSPAKATNASRANRRHSFLPQHTPLVFAPSSAKKPTNRRHTFQPGGLGIFLASSDASFDKNLPELDNVPSITVSESENTTSTIELSTVDESTISEQPAPAQDSTVVVDVRTNLDIFGLGPPVQTHHSSPTSDHHVSFDLKTHTEKPVKSTPSKSTNDVKATAPAPSPTPKSSNLLDVPTEMESSEDPNDQSLDTVAEEDTIEVSNDSTPRSLSPDMDIDITEEDSREVTDEMGIVSRRRATELDESLLLPLPETETTETEIDNDNEMQTEVEAEMQTETKGDDYGWQSPTSAELGQQDTVNVPQQDEPTEASAPSPSTANLDFDMDLLVDENDDAEDGEVAKDDELADDIEDVDDRDIEDIDEVEDIEEVEDVEAVEDVFTAPPPNLEDISDSSSPARSGDEENGEYTLTQPINMFPRATDDDATTTMTMDFDNLAEDQLSSHSDSETEMLRKFVTRVKADKSAKAAAAAEEASARSLAIMQRKRRSGSTGSTASSSGSPMTRETRKEGGSIFASPFTTLEAARVPFGKKDHNMSPSPRKKRRALTGISDGNENRAEDLLSKPSFDDNSPPRPKRRRKKMEADTGSIFNPEFMNAKKEKDEAAAAGEGDAPGPRRSKRTRSQAPLKSAATTANSTNGALSLIPVRLPGSLNLNGDDSYGLSASSLSIRRNDEKDLAATTRVNTRKNKGNADPPCIVVARQSHEALRAMREQKSVFDSPLLPQKTSGRDKGDRADSEGGYGKSRKTKKSSKLAKSVRWAEVLARFQTDGETSEKTVIVTSPKEASPEEEPVSKSSSSLRTAEQQLPVDTVGAPEPTPASSVSSAPLPTSVPSAAAPPQSDSDKTSIPRRTTRVSRLQPPTPRKVIASAAAAKAAVAPPPPSAEPASMGLKAQPAGGRMATRRAKIVGMGMAGNGTPAPKRRITRTT
ncbi:hypothetical protein Sste5346_006931 [Sporothrix stenoceras]|uniref:Uncharacterized protein n=1 Tax=Sporothrix stenoceras TaxID=5173 RepID=A0ABR3YXL0_9PEZI